MSSGPGADAYAKHVDQMYGDASDARRYLSTEGSIESGIPSNPARLAVLDGFIAALEKMMDGTWPYNLLHLY